MPTLLIQHDPSSSTSEELLLKRNHKAFYQVMKFAVFNFIYWKREQSDISTTSFFSFSLTWHAQNVIAICGWDPQLLPYIVICGERYVMPSIKNNGCTITKNTKISCELSPIIMIHI
jgi:hypothetical protein